MSRDEQIMAYVDGELAGEARLAFEAEAAADPQLAAAIARHQRLGRRISDAYDPVLDEEVPPQLVALASAANDPTPRRNILPSWAGVAAALAVGVLAGRALAPPPGPLTARGGVLEARGDLASALSTQLAAQPGPVKVGFSFRTAQGDYCRTFASERHKLAGLACRTEERWRIRTAAAWAPGAGPAYRTAGSETPPEVLAAVDRLIAGEPLDAAAEQAARARGWSR